MIFSERTPYKKTNLGTGKASSTNNWWLYLFCKIEKIGGIKNKKEAEKLKLTEKNKKDTFFI